MIYKLNYTDKETAIKDFLNKGVYIEIENIDKKTAIKDFLKKGTYIETEKQLVYGKGIQAIVEIGKIVLTNGTYDADFNEITAPVYAEGYAYDIMSDIEYKFESEIFPNNPKHNFAGCEPIKEPTEISTM
jgi:hypothetical protein